MPEIVAVEARVHQPHDDSFNSQSYAGKDSFLFVRLRVRLSDGLEGEGFTGRFLAAEVKHFLNGGVANAILGRDPLNDDNLYAKLAGRLNPRHMTGVVVSALSALDIAFHDLRAKAKGVSVSDFLGGIRKDAPVHVTCGFPALTTDQLVTTCFNEIAAGAGGVKILVGGGSRSLVEDADRVRAVRGAIGDDATLVVDANCAYDLSAAMEFQKLTAELALAWFEEPVQRNDVVDLTALAQEKIHPIGAGQMEQSVARFKQLIEAGISVVQPNAVFCGGIGPAISLSKMVSAVNCLVSPAGGWDFVNLHWVCGAHSSGPVELHRAHDRMAQLLAGGPTPIRNGHIAPLPGPGLGLSPDEYGLSACAV